jgi:hypothetical protein
MVADLQVYVIWFSMLPTDARSRWRWTNNAVNDPRVKHYWDEDRLVGQWFAAEVEGYEGIVWDAYYLYGPEANWGNEEPLLLSSGYTVYDGRESLLESIELLLE